MKKIRWKLKLQMEKKLKMGELLDIKNLKMTKTDDRLYPNKTNLPGDLKYSKERVFNDINNENDF